MKTVYLNKVGDGGLVSVYDFPTFEIPLDSINDGINFRFKNGFITRTDGWEKINFNLVGTGFEGFRFHSGTILNSGDHQGMIFILYKPIVTPPPPPTTRIVETPALRQFPGMPSTRIVVESVKLARWDGKFKTPADLTLIDISPTQGLALTYIDQPQLFSYLGAVYCNLQDGAPLVYRPWDPINEFVRMDIDYTAPAPVPPEEPYFFFPENWRIKVLVPFNNHLVGIGYADGTTDKNYQVVWSDIFEDADFLPDWNPKPENEAGSTILPDAFGDSFAAVPLGDSLMIYTLTTTFRLYPIGLPLVFGLEKVFPNVGCVGANCVQEFENNHFVATLNNAYVHNGNTLQSVADGRVAKYITNMAANFDAIGVFHNFITKEMYLYFSKKAAQIFADEMLIYNYSTNQWAKAECPQVSSIASAYGLNDALTWDKMTNRSYGQINVDYETLKRTTANWTFYYISQIGASSVEQNKPDIYLRNGVTYNTSFQRDYLDLLSLDGANKDIGVQKYVYEMIVLMKGAKKIRVTVSSSMGMSGPIKEKSVTEIDYDLKPWGSTAVPTGELLEYKIDLRVTGRYLSYKIEKIGTVTKDGITKTGPDDGVLEIKSIQFKYKPRGLR